MSDDNTLNTSETMLVEIPCVWWINLQNHTGTKPFDWRKMPEDKRAAALVHLGSFAIKQKSANAASDTKGEPKEVKRQAVWDKFVELQAGTMGAGGGGGGARLDAETRAEIEWLKSVSDSGAAAKVNGKTVEDLLKSKMRAEITNTLSGDDNAEKREEFLGKINELFPEWRTKHRESNPVLASLIEIEKQKDALKGDANVGVSSGMFG